MKFFGPLIIKKYPYSSNFFYDKALQVRRSVSGELAYLGGVDSKQSIEKITGAGFQWIALARPLIHDPEFLNKIKSGELEASSCNRCNECIVEMDRDGVKCVLNES
jgi:2,4-dienoyl-CoA reductase-like NADH-dependent reductase (Old Yellow Enzyme family)